MSSLLEYGKPLPAFRRRRVQRWLCRAGAVAMVLVGIGLAQYATKQMRILRCQRACMEYTAPETQVVWEDGMPAGTVAPPAGGVLTSASLHPPVIAAAPVACWENLWAASTGGYQPAEDGVLFLHERVSPSGNKRLIRVRLNFRGATALTLDCRVITPAGFFSAAYWRAEQDFMAAVASFPYRYPDVHGRKVRAFAGQADPKVPDHFTIACDIGGRKTLIDGVLQDDDTVVFLMHSLSPVRSPQRDNTHYVFK
ncbi:MAG: hypothetical protein JWO87_1299 [Phycisphaerales bacterium]|nr:hypothetical protein [Phycisphaerales bacterium]